MSKGREILAQAVELANQTVSPPHLIVTIIITSINFTSMCITSINITSINITAINTTAINILIAVLTNREGADSRVG